MKMFGRQIVSEFMVINHIWAVNMIKKQILGMLIIFFSMQSYAELPKQQLTQNEYNQRIQSYTDQVNATKAILDEPDSKANAAEQRKAFCSRLEAYQGILTISNENIQLDTANIMSKIAINFLDRQNQSLEESGMTSQVFCGSKVN